MAAYVQLYDGIGQYDLGIDSLRLPYPGRYEIAILIGGREVATQLIDAEVDEEGAAGRLMFG